MVNLFGACSKLVMKAVTCIDRVSSHELNPELLKDLNNLLLIVENQTSSLTESINVLTPFDCTKFKVSCHLFL